MRERTLDPRYLQRPPSAKTVMEIEITHEHPDNINTILEEDQIDSVNVEQNKSKKACIECIKPVPVHSYKQINPGDHILFVRSNYDHHAIVIEVHPVTQTEQSTEENEHLVRLKLIHQTNSTFGAIKDFIIPRRRIARLKLKEETIDLQNQKTLICKYWGTIKHYTQDEIIERAKEAVDTKQDQFHYSIRKNNCEHFATWCVTGRKLSVQTRKIRLVRRLFLNKGFRGVSDERARNEYAKKNGLLCDICYDRNDVLLSVQLVQRKPIRDNNDVNIGDIIMYKYYKLWHCAVVLDVFKRKERHIRCKIAHYAFCGPFSHRTIKEEPLKISLDGSVIVFIYDAKKFNLYEPEEVVARAKSRIGEQLFVFFSNDSSTFSRWCKLKLF